MGARFAHGLITLEYAADIGCRACATPGGGCQFLGTAATSQVIGEALGMSLPHSALAPSGHPIWLDMARRSARAVLELQSKGVDHEGHSQPRGAGERSCGPCSVRWIDQSDSASLRNRSCCRTSASFSRRLDGGEPPSSAPGGFPSQRTAEPSDRAGVSGRRSAGSDVAPARCRSLEVECAWRRAAYPSEKRSTGGSRASAAPPFVSGLQERDGVVPIDVIMGRDEARKRGLTSTVVFPDGNLAPEGSVIKSTAIDPSVVDADGVYRKTGPAKIFLSEPAVIAAIKSGDVKAGDILVLICRGPLGPGWKRSIRSHQR